MRLPARTCRSYYRSQWSWSGGWTLSGTDRGGCPGCGVGPSRRCCAGAAASPGNEEFQLTHIGTCTFLLEGREFVRPADQARWLLYDLDFAVLG